MIRVLISVFALSSPLYAQGNTFYDVAPRIAEQANALCGGVETNVGVGTADLAALARRLGASGEMSFEQFSSNVMALALKSDNPNALEIAKIYSDCVTSIVRAQAAARGLDLGRGPVQQCGKNFCRTFKGCEEESGNYSCSFTIRVDTPVELRLEHGSMRIVDEYGSQYPWDIVAVGRGRPISTTKRKNLGDRVAIVPLTAGVDIPVDYQFYSVPRDRGVVKVAHYNGLGYEDFSFFIDR